MPMRKRKETEEGIKYNNNTKICGYIWNFLLYPIGTFLWTPVFVTFARTSTPTSARTSTPASTPASTAWRTYWFLFSFFFLGLIGRGISSWVTFPTEVMINGVWKKTKSLHCKNWTGGFIVFHVISGLGMKRMWKSQFTEEKVTFTVLFTFPHCFQTKEIPYYHRLSALFTFLIQWEQKLHFEMLNLRLIFLHVENKTTCYNPGGNISPYFSVLISQHFSVILVFLHNLSVKKEENILKKKEKKNDRIFFFWSDLSGIIPRNKILRIFNLT